MPELRAIKTTIVLDTSNLQEVLQKVKDVLSTCNPFSAPTPAPQVRPFLTLEEVVDLSRFSDTTVRKAITEGRLKATQPEGREYRIAREDFMAWMSTPPLKVETTPIEWFCVALSRCTLRINGKRIQGKEEESLRITPTTFFLDTAQEGEVGVGSRANISVGYMGSHWKGVGERVPNDQGTMFLMEWKTPMVLTQEVSSQDPPCPPQPSPTDTPSPKSRTSTGREPKT